MISLLLFLACTEPDPDAVGPRWDTGSDPRPTTTDPSPLTVVDTATTPTGDTGGDPGLCLGEGDARVRIGVGGLQSFDAYRDGDALSLTTGPDGRWGIRLDLLSEGLDTSASMNVILRVTLEGNGAVEGATEEYLALVRMQCPRPGPGWVQVFAALPDHLQVPAGQGQLDGMETQLALSLIDTHREEDTVRVEVLLD